MPRLPAAATRACASTRIRSRRRSRSCASPSKTRAVFLSVLGISWFWFFGAVLLSVLPIYARDDAARARARGDAVSSRVLRRHRARLAALRDASRARTSSSAWCRFGSIGMTLFTLDLFFVGTPERDAARRRSTSGRSCATRARAAHPVRPVRHRAVRRLLHRAALHADPAARGAQRALARGRRQQHPQRAVHGGRRRPVGGLFALELHVPVRLPDPGRAAQRCGAIYIYSLLPEFLLRFVRLDPVAHDVPARGARTRATSRRPAPWCWCATTSSFVDFADRRRARCVDPCAS